MSLFNKKKMKKLLKEVGLKKISTQKKETVSEEELKSQQSHLEKNHQDKKEEHTSGLDKTSILFSKSTAYAPTSLLLLKGPEELIGISWILDQAIISIGRSFSLNDITVPHPNLSKKHFQILKEREEFYVIDLKSTNGTTLNDKELTPYKRVKLKDNDYIKASSVIFKFLGEGNIEAVSSKKIFNKASTDALTGIGNRQLLKMKGRDYFHLEFLSLIVFDIDKFKDINDNFGHSAGDYVLKMIATNILEVIRDNDLFIRYGGDEFCLLSPEPLSQAYKIAERIRYQIENMNLIFDNQPIKTELSIGVAEKTEEDKSWQDIYHRADKLSYEEKNRKKR